MKKRKLKQIIQTPLRFHHQDIHEEIDELKGMIRDVSSQVQGLRERIDKYIEVTGVRLPKHDDPEGG